MQLTAQRVARNTTDGVVVLSSDPTGKEYVEWQAAGDPAGGDVQFISAAIADSVPFRKIVQKGIIKIESEDDARAALDAQTDAFHRGNSVAAERAQESIENVADNDMISIPCVGPSTRGQGACGADVTVRSAEKDAKAPLCLSHEGLSHEYVSQDLYEGNTRKVSWLRVQMGATERQYQN